MKKQYLLLLALAAGLANNLVAMEGDDRGQKRKHGEEIVETQEAKDKSKKTKVDEEEKPFGDLSVLPDDILKEISKYLPLEDLRSLSLTDKAFNKFVKSILSKMRTQVLKELEEYVAQHQEQAEDQLNAFHLAAKRHDKEFICKYLPLVYFLKKDIINQRNIHGQTAMEALLNCASISSNEHLELLQLFNTYGGLFQSSYLRIALDAVQDSDDDEYYYIKGILELNCKQTRAVYDDADDDDFHGATLRYAMREHHKCDKCFPDNQ